MALVLSPLGRQCKKAHHVDLGVTLYLEGISMAKKGQTFRRYTEEFKWRAVQMYEQGKMRYKDVAEVLGMSSTSPIKAWVKKYRNGESFSDGRGRTTKENPFAGRPRTTFQSVEEERDYLKAQVEYLKKRYPNLHGEDGFKK
jgi:transposase